MANLSHGSVCPSCFGELGQEVLVQRDVVIQVAKDMSEFLLTHNGELQHWVMICLSEKNKTQTEQGGC